METAGALDIAVRCRETERPRPDAQRRGRHTAAGGKVACRRERGARGVDGPARRTALRRASSPRGRSQLRSPHCDAASHAVAGSRAGVVETAVHERQAGQSEIERHPPAPVHEQAVMRQPTIEMLEFGARVVEAAGIRATRDRAAARRAVHRTRSGGSRVASASRAAATRVAGLPSPAAATHQGLEEALPRTMLVALGVSQAVVADVFSFTPVPRPAATTTRDRTVRREGRRVAPAAGQFCADRPRAASFVVGADQAREGVPPEHRRAFWTRSRGPGRDRHFTVARSRLRATVPEQAPVRRVAARVLLEFGIEPPGVRLGATGHAETGRPVEPRVRARGQDQATRRSVRDGRASRQRPPPTETPRPRRACRPCSVEDGPVRPGARSAVCRSVPLVELGLVRDRPRARQRAASRFANLPTALVDAMRR